MTSSENPININIQKGLDNQEDKYNEFKDYIIKNNIELQKEIKSNLELIKSQEAKIQTHEEEEDKYDTRIRYMKGLLQNLNQLQKLHFEIKTKTEIKIEIVRDHNKKTKAIYYQIYLYLVVINILTLVTPFTLTYFNLFNLLLQTLYIIAIPFMVNKIKNNYYSISTISKQSTDSLKQQTSEINIIKQEIKKIEDSSISIDNWIDEV